MHKSKKEKLEEQLLKEEMESVEIPIDEPVTEETEKDTGADEKTGSQAEFYKDQFLRKAAEFENYKRRTENEISNVYRYANEGLISELLPVLDDFNRIKSSWNEDHDPEAFKKGIDLVYEKFIKVLEKQGLKEIDASGKKFDVNLHEAVLQQPSKDTEPETVTGVVEKGYYLKDKVIRHAKVIVSSPSEEEK